MYISVTRAGGKLDTWGDLSRYSSRVLTILSYAHFDKAGCKISDSFFTWPSDQGNSPFPGIGPKAILMKSLSHGLSKLRASTPSFSDRSPKAIYKSILMSHTSSNILQEVLLYINRPRDRTWTRIRISVWDIGPKRKAMEACRIWGAKPQLTRAMFKTHK